MSKTMKTRAYLISRLNDYGDPRAIPVLIDQLDMVTNIGFNPGDTTRGEMAAGALINIGEPAIPALLQEIKSSDLAQHPVPVFKLPATLRSLLYAKLTMAALFPRWQRHSEL